MATFRLSPRVYCRTGLGEDLSAARLFPCSAARQRVELTPATFLPCEQHYLFGSIPRADRPQPAHCGVRRPSGAAALHLDENQIEKIAALYQLVIRVRRVLANGDDVDDPAPLATADATEGNKPPPLGDSACQRTE